MGLITADEKKRITDSMANTSSLMVTAVARLYLTDPNPSKWTYTNIMGAVCLVLDRLRDTQLIQMYNLETIEKVFEFELYEGFEYQEQLPYFHAFEMEDCVAGLSFADEAEARTFRSRVVSLAPKVGSSNPHAAPPARKNSKIGTKVRGFFNRGKKKKSEKAPTMVIGEVTQVVHTSHIGLNADGTFKVNELPLEWKQMFRMVGIRKKDLRNKESARAILEVMTMMGADDNGELPPQQPQPAAIAEESPAPAPAAAAAATATATAGGEQKRAAPPPAPAPGATATGRALPPAPSSAAEAEAGGRALPPPPSAGSRAPPPPAAAAAAPPPIARIPRGAGGGMAGMAAALQAGKNTLKTAPPQAPTETVRRSSVLGDLRGFNRGNLKKPTEAALPNLRQMTPRQKMTMVDMLRGRMDDIRGQIDGDDADGSDEDDDWD